MNSPKLPIHQWDLDLSIVVPARNEEGNVYRLSREIEQAMESSPWSWECIWVDDGSTDATGKIVKQVCADDRRIGYVTLSRNYGQSIALLAGFYFARGDLLATLDADGQNDPRDLPVMVRELVEKDVCMVNGVRSRRQDTLVKKVSSRIANSFRNRLLGEHVTDIGCGIRVFQHECIEHLPHLRCMHRFLPTLVGLYGYSAMTEVPVNHRRRLSGKTKYSINNRLWVGLIDCLTIWWLRRRVVHPEVRERSIRRISRKGRKVWTQSG